MDLTVALAAVIGAGCLVIAALEWFDREPVAWVVKVRLWWHRRQSRRPSKH